MSPFALNLTLTLAWCAVMGTVTTTQLFFGFFLSYAALWLVQPLMGNSEYFQKVVDVVRLSLYFLYDLLVSSLRVLYDVMTPSVFARPGIVAVPLKAETDLEILMVANLVTLTPGTLSLDVSEDRKTLYVHCMFLDEGPDAIREQVESGLERYVLEALR